MWCSFSCPLKKAKPHFLSLPLQVSLPQVLPPPADLQPFNLTPPYPSSPHLIIKKRVATCIHPSKPLPTFFGEVLAYFSLHLGSNAMYCL